MTKPKARRKPRKPEEFYVLLDGNGGNEIVINANWATHGKRGAYDSAPVWFKGEGRVIKVREVLPRKRKP